MCLRGYKHYRIYSHVNRTILEKLEILSRGGRLVCEAYRNSVLNFPYIETDSITRRRYIDVIEDRRNNGTFLSLVYYMKPALILIFLYLFTV